MTYAAIADAYDVLYASAGKDYEGECERLRALMAAKRPGIHSLLDVGCGTGMHLKYFKEMALAGVDASADMLAAARARVPGVPLHHADMRTFDLSTRFDAVVCLFSAIGNVYPVSEMRRAVGNMVRHLLPGGILVVEPWYSPDDPKVWRLKADAGNSSTVAVARTVRAWKENGDCKLCVDVRWLIARDGHTELVTEYHEMGLYSRDEYVAAARDAGCDVEWDDVGLTGRGLIIGVRSAVPEA